jgi:hypothetical protein
MPLNFPSTGLTANQTTYSFSGNTWIWNGYAWDSVSTGATGATGSQGATGAQGPTGATGPVGDYVAYINGRTGAFGLTGTQYEIEITGATSFVVGLPDNTRITSTLTINGGTAWHSLNDGAGSGLDADAIRGVSGDRLLEEIQTGLLYGGVITINAGNTAAVDVSAGAGIIATVNASTGGYPAPSLQTIQWTAKTGVTLAGMTSSDFTFLRIDSSGNLQQSSNNFTQSQYLNSVVIGNVVHQSRSFVNRVHYHPIVAYASSAQYETFIRYFGGLKVDGYVMSGYGTTGGIQHTTGTAFALGANMDVDPNNPSLVTDSSAVPVQQLFYLYRNADGTYRTDPVSRTTVNFGNYDDGDGTLGNVGNQSWSIQRVYKIPGVNNALYIYYGTAVYSSLTVASNNILLESFAEADITRYNGVFLGWLVVRGNGSNVSSTGDCRIVPGGFFRNTTGGGGASTQLNFDDLADVDITSVANNQILRYDSTQGLWVNSAVTTLPLVTSFNGLTGAVTGVTVGGANTFDALNTFNSGLTANNLWVTNGATFASLATFSSGLSSGSTITVNNAIQVAQPAANTTALVLRTRATNSNFITINATGGNVTVAPGTGVLRVTQGYGSSGTITNSSRGYLTLQGTDGDVLSFDVTIDPSTALSASRTLTCPNLSGTLAVVNAAQTFSALQSFTAGITANALYVSTGATFASRSSFTAGLTTDNLWVTNGVTFAGTSVHTGLGTFNSGITANNLWVTNGATFSSTAAFTTGITANNLWVTNGATFAGAVSSDTGYRVSSSAVNTQTGTSYSLTASDNGKIITMNNGATSTVTIIGGLPIGFNATIIQLGAGNVGFTSASGVTLNSFASSLNMAGQHGAAAVISYATNIFNLSGTLTV